MIKENSKAKRSVKSVKIEYQDLMKPDYVEDVITNNTNTTITKEEKWVQTSEQKSKTYNINEPWLTLDDFQKRYIYDEIKTGKPTNNLLICGRQVGKTTAMSIKAGELAIHLYKKGDKILIIALTERQAFNIFFKTLNYLQARYPKHIATGKDKPTMHKITLKNGVTIECQPTGLTGAGIRGLTVKKLIVDEASRIPQEVFDAITPMLSVSGGSIDVASTPCGKKGYFYECSLRDDFVKEYVSAEDCPRHDKEFLKKEKETKSSLVYAQEYLGMFLDDLLRLFSDELIKQSCILKRREGGGRFYLGVDVGGLGEDLSTFEIFDKVSERRIEQRDNLTTKRTYVTDTVKKILMLERGYKFKLIGIDNGGLGVGVFHPLLKESAIRHKVIGLNNAQKDLDRDGKKKTSLLKEDMYFLTQSLMEQKILFLLDDDAIIESLMSIQYELVIDENKKTKYRIYGSDNGKYTHITEGIIRAVYLAFSDKSLKVWAR